MLNEWAINSNVINLICTVIDSNILNMSTNFSFEHELPRSVWTSLYIANKLAIAIAIDNLQWADMIHVL